MAKQRTWELACERKAYSDRTFPAAPGINAGQNSGEMSTARSRVRPGRRHAFESTKVQYRDARPATGKRDWAEGESREHYTDPTNVLASLARTGRQRRLVGSLRELLAERQRDGKLGDVPTERLTRLEDHIRAEADFLAGVTTGDRDRAALIAQGARNIL
jgi:hypothetical protein